MVIINTW